MILHLPVVDNSIFDDEISLKENALSIVKNAHNSGFKSVTISEITRNGKPDNKQTVDIVKNKISAIRMFKNSQRRSLPGGQYSDCGLAEAKQFIEKLAEMGYTHICFYVSR